MFKNMKIEINESQSVEDVCGELERLGYVKPNMYGNIIYTSNLGNSCTFCDLDKGLHELIQHYPVTTLQQLKEMK